MQLASAMSVNASLTALDLVACDVSDAGAQALREHAPRLRDLNLAGNLLSAGLEAELQALCGTAAATGK